MERRSGTKPQSDVSYIAAVNARGLPAWRSRNRRSLFLSLPPQSECRQTTRTAPQTGTYSIACAQWSQASRVSRASCKRSRPYMRARSIEIGHAREPSSSSSSSRLPQRRGREPTAKTDARRARAVWVDLPRSM